MCVCVCVCVCAWGFGGAHLCDEVLNVTAEVDVGGETFVQMFGRHAASLGYSVRALALSHQVWVANSRNRVYIVGVSQSHGGAEAATWIANNIQNITHHRQSCGPPAVFDVVDASTEDHIW